MSTALIQHETSQEQLHGLPGDQVDIFVTLQGDKLEYQYFLLFLLHLNTVIWTFSSLHFPNRLVYLVLLLQRLHAVTRLIGAHHTQRYKTKVCSDGGGTVEDVRLALATRSLLIQPHEKEYHVGPFARLFKLTTKPQKSWSCARTVTGNVLLKPACCDNQGVLTILRQCTCYISSPLLSENPTRIPNRDNIKMICLWIMSLLLHQACKCCQAISM